MSATKLPHSGTIAGTHPAPVLLSSGVRLVGVINYEQWMFQWAQSGFDPEFWYAEETFYQVTSTSNGQEESFNPAVYTFNEILIKVRPKVTSYTEYAIDFDVSIVQSGLPYSNIDSNKQIPGSEFIFWLMNRVMEISYNAGLRDDNLYALYLPSVLQELD